MPRNRVAYLGSRSSAEQLREEADFFLPSACRTPRQVQLASAFCLNRRTYRRPGRAPQNANCCGPKDGARSEPTRLDEQEPETREQHRSEEGGTDTQA